MTTWGAREQAALASALDEFDDALVRDLCAQYVDAMRAGAATVRQGEVVLRYLQRKRRTSDLSSVAEAILAWAPAEPNVVHRYSLALLDEQRPVAAEALLSSVVTDSATAGPELQGAIGRLHKVRYVTPGLVPESSRPDELRAAIDVYRMSFEQDPVRRSYQGINAAALLSRAAADGVDVGGDVGGDAAAVAAEIAERILREIEALVDPGVWASATAAEACLVVGRHEEAADWLAHYTSPQAGADAFEYASTLRQFQQVWQLVAGRSPGRELLPLLRARLLSEPGGSCALEPDDYTLASLERIEDVQHERVLGHDQFKTLGWWRDGLDKCRSVAMVQDKYGDGQGTAFVISGRAIHDAWPDRVVLTNAHVVPQAVDADDAWAGFYGINDQPGAGHVVRLGRILWQSPPDEFDACILELAEPLSDEAAALPVRARLPVLDGTNPLRAYVIGHPLGQPRIRLSVHDTLLLDLSERYAHYRSPTMHGSSGSPVFDDQWRVIALHHGYVGAEPRGQRPSANEGIRMDRLLAAAGASAS